MKNTKNERFEAFMDAEARDVPFNNQYVNIRCLLSLLCQLDRELVILCCGMEMDGVQNGPTSFARRGVTGV